MDVSTRLPLASVVPEGTPPGPPPADEKIKRHGF